MHDSKRSDLASGARFSLRQLEAFRAVAALGSAARAAGELGRTPSAISMALRELQSALGIALLQRSGRGLVLTTAGERLLPKADELLLRGSARPSDRLELYVFGSKDGNQARLVAMLDNLGKGASGAAVQSLNLMAGLEETAGLQL